MCCSQTEVVSAVVVTARQSPISLSEVEVRPPRTQPPLFLDQPQSPPQSRPQVNWLQASVGAGVGELVPDDVGGGVGELVVGVMVACTAAQTPRSSSELVVRPPGAHPPLFFDQPQFSPALARSRHSCPQEAEAHTEVGAGLGLRLGGTELGAVVCAITVVIMVGPAVRQSEPRPAEHEPSSWTTVGAFPHVTPLAKHIVSYIAKLEQACSVSRQ